MKTPELIVFGCLTPDNVVTADGECLPQTFGGNALYGALGARVWSDRVGMVSRYGTGYPAACFELLRSLGVNIDGVRHLGKAHGRNVAFAYRADGSRTRSFPASVINRIPVAERHRFIDTSLLPDAAERWLEFSPDETDVPAEWWPSVRGIHCATMPVAKHVRIAAGARARFERSAWIQIDSPWFDTGEKPADHTPSLFPALNAFLPSEADVAAFWPGTDLNRRHIALLDGGAEFVVLKLGAAGCRIFKRGQGLIAEIPVVDVRAEDPTGAGDAFCGGFLAGLLETGDVVEAARFGTVSASFAVQAHGLRGLVERSGEEATNRLASLRIAAIPVSSKGGP